MSDPESFRQKTRDQSDREVAAVLAELQITGPEASLFNVVHFGLTVPPLDLCDRAAVSSYCLCGPVTAEENRVALAGCLSKGWLQIIDEDALGRIQDDIRRNELLGPVYGYPSLGGVDFTHAGAAQWLRICERLWGAAQEESFAFCDVVHEKSAHYFRSRSKAVAEQENRREWESVVSVAGPYPIGPWRANWWRWFPEGYRIDVEERMKWWGRSSTSRACVFCGNLNLPFTLTHAKDVLDRHSVAWVEWLVMMSLEHAAYHNSIDWQVARNSKRLGSKVTEEEASRGLEICLRNGWVRRVDENAIAEINHLLDTDSAAMPVALDLAEDRWGAFDFSIEGAFLYRSVTAEIFGPDWEDSVSVEKAYFREEHRYCATKAGLDVVRQEYEASGEIPVIARTVEIGPWCVYWWERFSSDYRLEMHFGDP